MSLGLLGTPVVRVVVAAAWLGEAPGLSLVTAIVLIPGGAALGSVDEPGVAR